MVVRKFLTFSSAITTYEYVNQVVFKFNNIWCLIKCRDGKLCLKKHKQRKNPCGGG